MLLRNGRHWEIAMLRLVLQALLIMHRYDTLRRKSFRDGSRLEQVCAGDRVNKRLLKGWEKSVCLRVMANRLRCLSRCLIHPLLISEVVFTYYRQLRI